MKERVTHESKSKEPFGIILGIVIVVIFLVFLGYLFKVLVTNLDKVNPNITVAIIAGSITIISYLISRYYERKKDIEFQIREQKLPIYEEFIGFIFQMLFDEKYEKMQEPQKKKLMSEFVAKFSKRSILWLSDESLTAYINWKRIAANVNTSQEEQLASLEDLFLAFRKDVGHTNKNLKRGDILSIFITDYLK